MVSAFIKHNFLLSSKTVFIFSIQSAETGPSKIINYFSLFVIVDSFRKISARTPSVHSLLTGSLYPYNYFMDTAFGFIM